MEGGRDLGTLVNYHGHPQRTLDIDEIYVIAEYENWWLIETESEGQKYVEKYPPNTIFTAPLIKRRQAAIDYSKDMIGPLSYLTTVMDSSIMQPDHHMLNHLGTIKHKQGFDEIKNDWNIGKADECVIQYESCVNDWKDLESLPYTKWTSLRMELVILFDQDNVEKEMAAIYERHFSLTLEQFRQAYPFSHQRIMSDIDNIKSISENNLPRFLQVRDESIAFIGELFGEIQMDFPNLSKSVLTEPTPTIILTPTTAFQERLATMLREGRHNA